MRRINIHTRLDAFAPLRPATARQPDDPPGAVSINERGAGGNQSAVLAGWGPLDMYAGPRSNQRLRHR